MLYICKFSLSFTIVLWINYSSKVFQSEFFVQTKELSLYMFAINKNISKSLQSLSLDFCMP